MKTRLILTSMIILLFAACRKEGKLNETDQNFLMMAAFADYAEIETGELATSQGTNEQVRDFGTMMMNEHEEALNELKTFARDKDLELPVGPDAVHVAAKQQLMLLSGRAFDSTYIHMQVMDHLSAINLFQQVIDKGQNEAVREYAEKRLPALRMHFNIADSIASAY